MSEQPPAGSFTEPEQAKSGGWLILVGVLLFVAAVALWFRDSSSGVDYIEPEEPDRTPAIVVGALGAVAFLGGIILYAKD